MAEKRVKPSLTVGSIAFYDAPNQIEGAPYWVDLWASVNGYRLGLQIKPNTYQAASISIYTGKARSSQLRGHALFTKKFGGKVIVAMPSRGEVDQKTLSDILREVERLKRLTEGPYPPLPTLIQSDTDNSE